MATGFSVRKTIGQRPEDVWAYLIDFGHAKEWMTGIEEMSQITEGPIALGTRFRFRARGEERSTEVTAFERGKRIALTSTQGGVTATYTYSLAAMGDNTEMTLDAVCSAAGFWKLLHPLIVFAMRKGDSSHLAKLKNAMSIK